MMRIAITLGDPNGIGPEIAVKAAARFASDPALRPVLVASVAHGSAHDIAARGIADPQGVIETLRLLAAATPDQGVAVAR